LVANHDTGNVFGMENDTFASVLYLSLWSSVLLVGVLGSRRRLSHAFRDLAYWLLLLLILMTAYQYRYEAQDIASRLTAGVIPGSPMSISTTDRVAVMIDKSNNGHFEARVLMNGTPVQTLV